MKWSKFQQDIFNFVENGVGNAIIEAVAGSGKTTTIVEAINRVPMLQNTIFLAFNKSIAEELKARGVNARTFHSLCCGAVMRHKNSNSICGDKLQKLVRENFKSDDNYKYGSFVCKLVGLGKQIGIGALVPTVDEVWYAIIDHHDLELDKEGAHLSRAIDLANELLQLSNESTMTDFDDMLYLAVLDGLSLPKFDFIFVDEAQDTNAIQRAILRKIMKPNTRIVAVGDPAQAIYGFRGADSNSLNLIKKEFDCCKFPLSVSYRCASSIVEYAQKWVSHIQSAEGAPEGTVVNANTSWELGDIQPEDLVVCRTTKPLISVALKMLRKRIPVTVMGRDIGVGLSSLIKRFKTNNIDHMLSKLEQWEDRETERAIAKGEDAKVQAIADKVDCIRVLANDAYEDSDVNTLLATIEDLFANKSRPTPVFATIHKAKGLEADKVFWLESSKCPSKWAKQPWQKQQERNLCYVAATRAKTELVLIELDD